MANLYKVRLFDIGTNFKQAAANRNACITNNLLAIGWRPAGCGAGKRLTGYADFVKALDEYLDAHPEQSAEDFHFINRKLESLQKGDLCWTQVGRIYCLGKILDDAPDYGYFRQCPEMGAFRKCKWKFFRADFVPGVVLSALDADKKLGKVFSNLAEMYSEYLYDGKKPEMEVKFIDWFHAIDLSDLLSMYLQMEKGYIALPSTNYTLVNKDTGRKALIQCKVGQQGFTRDDILTGEFLGGDLFLTATSGIYPKYTKADIGASGSDGYDFFLFEYCKGWDVQHTYIIEPEILENFAINHKDLLPRRMQIYLELASDKPTDKARKKQWTKDAILRKVDIGILRDMLCDCFQRGMYNDDRWEIIAEYLHDELGRSIEWNKKLTAIYRNKSTGENDSKRHAVVLRLLKEIKREIKTTDWAKNPAGKQLLQSVERPIITALVQKSDSDLAKAQSKGMNNQPTKKDKK
jgi:hypothetical protein